jgi:F0F1-type ATP synthase epsilon subunit
MKLGILIPTEVLMDEDVNSTVAEGMEGSFCIRPSHIDYVSVLVPGLLHFHLQETKKKTEGVHQNFEKEIREYRLTECFMRSIIDISVHINFG